MRIAIAVACVLAAAGCSRSTYTPLTGDATATSYLFFVLDEGERILDLHAYESLPDPLLIELSEGTSQRVLAYDLPLDALLEVDAQHHAATTALGWRLPPPKTRWDLNGEAFERGAPADLAPWLATFFVPPPPCPPAPTVRPIGGLPTNPAITFAAPWAGGLLLGVQGDDAYLLMMTGAAVALDVLGPPADARSSVIGFVDGERAYVGWSDTSTIGLDLVGIDAAGQIIERLHTTHMLGPAITFESLAAGRFDGQRTLLARARDDLDITRSVEHILRLDEATRTWRSVLASSDDALEVCSGAISTAVLEVNSPTSALVGLANGPILTLDPTLADPLPTATPLVRGAVYCRSARTVMASGVELLTFDEPGVLGEPGVLWRAPPETAWEPIDALGAASGKAIGSRGDLAAVALSDLNIATVQRLAARPDRPPRVCHEVTIGLAVYHVVPFDDHTLLIAGEDGPGAVLVTLP